MMSVFVDTSALFALLSSNDVNHDAAWRVWEGLLRDQTPLVCSNYIAVEAAALVQRRLGMEALRAFRECICPLMDVEWVDRATHDSAETALLTANRRSLSLVDCTSFIIMRRLGIMRAFTFNVHFAEQDFVCLPEMRLHDR